LLDKLTDAEPAVRSAALQAVLSLNETNAIPRLEEAEQNVENPREKVAIMDAIAYLKLPDTMPAVPLTNDPSAMGFPDRPARNNSPAANFQNMKDRSSRAARRLLQSGQTPPGQPPGAAPPAAPPQDQPAAPDPAAAPPQ
jgi:HEAT repeat protein